MEYYTTNSTTKSNENGYGLTNCGCCPYGYHIDLDFVKFCELFSKSEADKTGSIKRRKDRRKQRQSIEVLLGIDPPVYKDYEVNYKPILEQESPKLVQRQQYNQKYLITQDEFDDAVSDFERTLQRSKKMPPPNLPDVTAVSYTENLRRVPSNSSISSASGSSMTVAQSTNEGQNQQDFDTISIESCGLSPMALQNIREQMALSLERTKQLEDQVKLIPELKEQLSSLKEENRRLQLDLYRDNQKSQQTYQVNYIAQIQNQRTRSQSFTNIDNIDGIQRKPPPPPPRKDFGVMCGVLTRNIGVGHQNPNTKSVATLTLNDSDLLNGNSDRWLESKEKFLSQPNLIRVSKGSQTIVSKEKRDAGIQTLQINKPVINHGTQTIVLRKATSDVGINNTPQLEDFSSQKTVDTVTIGTSQDSVNDIVCDKCLIKKEKLNGSNETTSSPISLASLSVPRSKSFNLGEDKLNLTRSKTVGCQYESSNISRYVQVTTNSYSKACQHETKQAEKQTQYEIKTSVTKTTDTKDLVPATINVACEAKVEKETSEVACDTESLVDKTLCNKCVNKDKEDSAKKDANGPSRIPRPHLPTTPVEARKFRRQDTYTKIYTSPTEKSSPTSLRLSGLDLSPRSVSAEQSPLDKVKHNFKFPDVSTTNQSNSSTQNGATVTKVQIQESTLPVSESTSFTSIHNQTRKKAIPSKEMQGAMKVLNDALLKNPSKSVKNPTAVNIVQQEWFKVSSLVTANPLTVEDYLDAFEDMSALLLQYVVNMTDASGNTAMHYAVSHGNFDVVSILLDSKVCDINKPNKTGYTSVMLVSLAEVKSETHANVVRRLFQLADVNIRAKQHGQTALMLAVSHGRLDMVRMLLEAGADINIQDEDGSTALMCAAEHGHIEIVKHFLSHPDCDSSITDVDGSSALTIAMEAGHRTVGVLLYTHERNHQKNHGIKIKKTKSASPKTPSSPLPIRSSHRALTDTKTSK